MLIHWLELKPEMAGVITSSPSPLELPGGSTVGFALAAIGIKQDVATALLDSRAVAVFGQYASEDTVLHNGDRLEILDALSFDPMESRRRRAMHKVKTKRQKELARHERRSRKQSNSAS
ncbi:MAG TPA: RnfH family protein [Limnobacter sp.]|nr:RnfH family protein [Limnobacter sp.]